MKRTKGKIEFEYDDNGFYYITGENSPSPYIVATGGEGDVNHANAAFIVRAWNNHDTLLAACKMALEYRQQTHHGDDKCIGLLRACINQAEQEEPANTPDSKPYPKGHYSKANETPFTGDAREI